MSIDSARKSFNQRIKKSNRSNSVSSLNKKFISNTAAMTPGITNMAQQSVNNQHSLQEATGAEVSNIGQSILLGLGIGAAVSAFNSRLTFKEKLAYSTEGAKLSMTGYLGGRMGGTVMSSITTSPISHSAQIAGIGASASIATSSYVFYKIRRSGGNPRQAVKGAGLNLAVSLTGVFTTWLASMIWGGPAGIIASVAFGSLILMFNFINNKKIRKMTRKLQIYEIEQLEPGFKGLL